MSSTMVLSTPVLTGIGSTGCGRCLSTPRSPLTTGHGFDVVDCDDDRFVGLHLAMLPTAPSWGYHLYIQATDSTSVSKLLPGTDLKGLGGYVVAPPSLHATGVRYMWRRDPSSQLGPVPKSIHKALGSLPYQAPG